MTLKLAVSRSRPSVPYGANWFHTCACVVTGWKLSRRRWRKSGRKSSPLCKEGIAALQWFIHVYHKELSKWFFVRLPPRTMCLPSARLHSCVKCKYSYNLGTSCAETLSRRSQTIVITTCTSSVGLTYIHTCLSYVHTPHASPAWRLRRRISTVMFTCGWAWAWPARWPIRPILGFWGSKVRRNLWFPALDADEPPNKIWRR